MDGLTARSKTVARALAGDAIAARRAAPDAAMARLLGQSVLDWTGSLLAGLAEPSSVAAAGEALTAGPGDAALIGWESFCGPRAAAMANAVAGHALDYDDVNLVMMGHPTAVAAPVLLALCARDARSGAAFLSALSIGCETMYRLSRYLGPGHYAEGWHATATVGAIGAAVGGACLMELDEDATVAAIGIAASHAGGMKVSFGTDVKPLQVGLAAATAVEAVRLAARGIRGADDVIEGKQGFAATHGGNVAGTLPPLGNDHRSILFKFHASCYGTQSAIEVGRALAAGGGAVERATLAVHPKWLNVCDIAEPRTPNEVKFSLRTTAAMGFLGRDTAAADAYASALDDAEVRALAGRIAVVGDEAMADAQAKLSATGTNGPREVTHDAGKPDDDLDRQEARLVAKFETLATPHLGRERASAAAREILAMSGSPRAAAVFETLVPG